jgi:hypothetical protein
MTFQKLTPEELDMLLEKTNFEMFTKGGNTACRNGVKRIFKKIRGKKRITEDELYEFVQSVINSIDKKHGEVWDTEPRGKIYRFTEKCCEQVGYKFNLY